jgi:hypothetical protein
MDSMEARPMTEQPKWTYLRRMVASRAELSGVELGREENEIWVTVSIHDDPVSCSIEELELMAKDVVESGSWVDTCAKWGPKLEELNTFVDYLIEKNM